jgi:hypothetical protein
MPFLLKSVTSKYFSLVRPWFPIPNVGAVAVAEEVQRAHPPVTPTKIEILFHLPLTIQMAQLKSRSSGEVCVFFLRAFYATS